MYNKGTLRHLCNELISPISSPCLILKHTKSPSGGPLRREILCQIDSLHLHGKLVTPKSTSSRRTQNTKVVYSKSDKDSVLLEHQPKESRNDTNIDTTNETYVDRIKNWIDSSVIGRRTNSTTNGGRNSNDRSRRVNKMELQRNKEVSGKMPKREKLKPNGHSKMKKPLDKLAHRHDQQQSLFYQWVCVSLIIIF